MNNAIMSYEERSLIKRRRRQRQLRRNYFIGLLAIAIVIIAMAILAVSLSVNANETKHNPSYKYYKSIRIEKGDTLWSIANEYGDFEHYSNTKEYIKEVRTINSLTSDNIVSGSYIIVPYYSEELMD